MGSGSSSNANSTNTNNTPRGNTTTPRNKAQPQPTPRAPGSTPSRSQEGFKEVAMNQQPTGSTPRQAGQPGSSQGLPKQSKTTGGKKDPGGYRDDDIVFETFHHQNGRVYTCLYRNQMRYYLDNWHTQEWQVFPMRWYNEGTLTTDQLVRGDQFRDHLDRKKRFDAADGTTSTGEGSSSEQAQSNSNGKARTDGVPRKPGAAKGGDDDREGFIRHPTRGKLPTYIFEEKRNIHCYYDEAYGQWVKLPLSWEMHSDVIKPLVEDVAEALPNWKDKIDILATLRACNYDPDDCIDTYLAWDDNGAMLSPQNLKAADAKMIEGKNKTIDGLQVDNDKMKKRLNELKKEVEQLRDDKNNAVKRADDYSEKLSSVQAESQVAMAHYEAMQQRPKTPARPKTPQEKRNPIDLDTLNHLNKTAITMHKGYNGLKNGFHRFKADINEYIVKILAAMKQMKTVEGSQAGEIEELRAAYRKECTQRKLLYNKLQELRGNIRVFARCRHDSRVDCALRFPNSEEIQAPPTSGTKKAFKFDKVFTPKSTQAEVFEDTLPIIMSCVDGYNVCILAYGQTGSGKTFTMMGPEKDPGVNVRSIRELLKICNEREKIKYTLKCSMVEIYNETIQDLLSSNVQALEIRSQGKSIQIPNITEMPVNTLDDIKEIIEKGDKNRHVASTKMNSTSSRSHLVMMINVEGHDNVSKATTKGVLTLCDLAGSERIGKTEASGQRLVEAAAINKSLSSLGQVFSALRTNQLHVPYRNSKLTHILQPCLSGDAKAALFVALSPDVNNIQESISTLQFGSNARQVALGQAKQNVSKEPGS
ncbi:uncharacterized protein LOC135490785 isoform X2 [Lineus longissimus]|uniref:uncharacterized protein LOC135490785 isoform X2 n=1 Tax=Lineus longissimus TaxID=88925 RepID=UPI00315CD73A